MRPGFLPPVLDGYTALGLDDQRRFIEERIVPVAYSPKERRIRNRDHVDFFGPRRKKSQLDDLNDLIGEHDNVRVALIRANPGVSPASLAAHCEQRPPGALDAAAASWTIAVAKEELLPQPGSAQASVRAESAQQAVRRSGWREAGSAMAGLAMGTGQPVK